ncbi:MAG: RMD1 family protein [Gammaproteobacteria bacterium]
MSEVAALACVITCLADAFDFSALKEKLLSATRAQALKNVVMVDHKGAWSFVFPYGTVVHWNVGLDDQLKLHTQLLRYAEKPRDEVEEETFTYNIDSKHNRILQDHIEIQSDEPMLLLSISHAMAQSIKLSDFEAHALKTIENTKHLPQSLAREGKIKLNRRDMAKIRGQLFLTKSDIILNYDLLDTPEFFWEHPEFEPFYTIAANYLEIRQRTDVLSKKLETIHELLEMLADEQKHQHSSTLEWIIIWLIAVEICISIVDKLL